MDCGHTPAEYRTLCGTVGTAMSRAKSLWSGNLHLSGQRTCKPETWFTKSQRNFNSDNEEPCLLMFPHRKYFWAILSHILDDMWNYHPHTFVIGARTTEAWLLGILSKVLTDLEMCDSYIVTIWRIGRYLQVVKMHRKIPIQEQERKQKQILFEKCHNESCFSYANKHVSRKIWVDGFIYFPLFIVHSAPKASP